MIRKKRWYLFMLLFLPSCLYAQEQFKVTKHQEGWNNVPPEAKKSGFSFQKSVLAQMDTSPALEEVMLFGKDNGHYPTFDLFKFYYVIVDNYTKEVRYTSPVYVSDRYELIVEDRNKDEVFELYISYFKDDKFTVDENGYNLRTERCYDRIEYQPK